tara:strand:+ start:3121 stop:4581 length:1461 start_codon:yes stop_codon:yes gene_type:complete
MKFYYVHDYEFDWETFPNAFDIINYTDEMRQHLDSKKSKVDAQWPDGEPAYWKVSQLIDKNVNIKYGGIPHTVRKIPFIKELENLPIEYKNISNIKVNDGNVYLYIVDLHGSGQHFLNPIEEEVEDNPASKQSYRNEGVGKISKKALNYLQNEQNFYLFVNYHWEGIMHHTTIDSFHKLLEKFKIPANKVIFTFAGFNQERWMKYIIGHYKIENPMNVLYSHWVYRAKGEEFLKEYRNEEFDRISKKYVIEKKKYDFNCLNRRLRTHRLYLLAKLKQYGLLEKNLVTYDFTIDDNINETKDLEIIAKREWMDFKFIDKYLFDIRDNRPSFHYDHKDLQKLDGLFWEDASVYNDSMFSVVTETSAHPGEYYISEKVFKPIGQSHPFIVFGSQGTLKELRDIGFKTFSPFIDETYDTVRKAEDRCELIMGEIVRLTNLSDSEKLEWMENIKPIIEYNRKFLFDIVKNYDKIISTKFKKNLLKIIKPTY